ncbi:PadR family transcriptional regulator [Nostoc sp.]|uniref:PadR family transcriptional regulator n=1 Tax=Nostoc sp. TaxID=1180 RepID=UPI002FF84EC9
MALAHAILAALVEASCSGYDLAKRFDGSVGFFWSASHQQIYRELSKLEDQRWISSESILQAGRPDKRLYSVTDLGEQHLQEWIAQPCEPTSIKDDLLVKIFAGHIVPKQIILAELEHHQKAHLKKLSTYKELEQRYFQNPQEQELLEPGKFQYLTLLNGISYETHWLAWCNQVMELVNQRIEN